jgi:hypothetical protein
LRQKFQLKTVPYVVKIGCHCCLLFLLLFFVVVDIVVVGGVVVVVEVKIST